MSAANLINANTGKIKAGYLPTYIQNDLQSPVFIQPASGSAGNFELVVNGNNASVYGGGLSLNPGSNSVAPNGAVGVNIRATANGCAVEIGTDGATGTVNTLGVAGPDGVGAVYNSLYNLPAALKAITLTNTDALAAPQAGNTGEIFRCSQAGVVAAGVSAIGTNFEVPQTGFYTLQIEVKLQNAVAPASPDINIAMVDVGGFDIGNTLTFTIADGVVVEPYGTHEFVSSEFAVGDIAVAGGNVIRLHTSQHLLEEGTVYGFFLRVTNSGASWNIGAGGQIKAELIAQC